MSIEKSRKPSILIVAGLHGDEVGASLVIKRLFKKLQHKIKKGSVYAFPLINKTGKRNLFKEDLNRKFPGKKYGNKAEMLTYQVFNSIKKYAPDFVLDLHNDWKKAIHYSVIEPGKSKASEKAREIAKASGLPVIIETDKITGNLASALLKQNITAITLELGDANIKNEKNIERGVKDIWNILLYLGTVKGKNSKRQIKKILMYSQGPKSSIKGEVKFFVKPGEIINKGQKVAEVYDNHQKEVLMAKEKALILGLTDSLTIKKGKQVVAFGNF